MIKKQQTREEVIAIFKMLNDLKIRCTASFMYDFPTETEEELEESFQLMKTLNAYITPFPVQVYPRTKLYDVCLENNINHFPTKTLEWAGYDYGHVHGFSNIEDIAKKTRWKIFYYTYLKNLKVAVMNRDWFTMRTFIPKVIYDFTHSVGGRN